MKRALLAVQRPMVVLAVGTACAFGGEASAGAQPAVEGQGTAAGVAEADRLFKQAAAHMDRREYDAACPLLEQSHALDPSSGTLLNLADCYEQRGATASAYRAFEEARALSSRTGRTDRAEVAELRKKQLLSRLRRLTIVPPSGTPETLLVYLDERPLARSSWNVPVPVDPGVHRVRASAHGHADYTVTVPAPDAGATVAVRIPALTPSSAAPSARARDAGPSGETLAALGCGVLGIAGVATGTVFGLRSWSKHEDSDRYCSGNVCREPRGVELMDDARRAGNVSTASFIIGGVGLGAAAVLWFARPFERGAVAAEIGVGPAAIRVRGRF